MANPKYDKETEFLLVAGRLNNRQKQRLLGQVEGGILTPLVLADNVDFDDHGETTQRLGRQLQLAGDSHSLWVHPHDDQLAYFVEDSALYRLNTDFTSTLITALLSNARMAYEVVNDEVVVSNGSNIGWLRGSVYDEFNPVLGQFELKTPAGQYLSFYRGVLYVLSGSVLYATKPWNVERMDERFCQFPLNGYGRMVGAVQTGIWVATDKEIGFITGKGIDEFEYNNMSDYAPPDGAFFVKTEEKEDGVENRVVTWVSQEGFCHGHDDGTYENQSYPDITLPDGNSGHLFQIYNNGINQYIAVIEGPEYPRIYTLPDLNTNEVTY